MKKYIPLILLKLETSKLSVGSLVKGVFKPKILIVILRSVPGSKRPSPWITFSIVIW